jgi:hypothetical protein
MKGPRAWYAFGRRDPLCGRDGRRRDLCEQFLSKSEGNANSK